MADKLITTQNDRTNAPQTSFYSTNDKTSEDQYEQEAKTSADQAKLYKNQAETARDAAQAAETAAKASESASAVNADIAQTAQSAADDAETSAGQASASEIKAKQWADEQEDTAVESGKFSARHHALKAEASASAASTSETNAGDSAAAAATSEGNAATSETNAANSASAAATSASDAQGYADLAEQLTSGARVYVSGYDASTGVYPIASPASGDAGKFWIVTTAGTISGTVFNLQDQIAIRQDLTYERVPSPYAVQTVNGQVGEVTITAAGLGALTASDVGTAAPLDVGTGANEIVQRNASGSMPGDITGNAATANNATQLAVSRNIALTGDASGSASFNGSSDISISVTVADSSHLHTLSTISDAGTAAARNVGAGASDLPDVAQLNTRLGTTGNLGNAATKTVGSGNGLDADLLDGVQGAGYLKKSEFDPSIAALVWSGSTTSPVPMTSLSKDGPGFYIIRDNNSQEISVYVRNASETAIGGAKGASASTDNLEVIWAIYQSAGFAIVGASVNSQFASAKTVTAIYKV